MKIAVIVAGAVIIVPILIFLGIGLQNDPNTIDSPLVGQPAPPFELQDLDGNKVRLADLKGRTVVMNFWATWCVPCRYEHGSFMEGSRRLKDHVAFLGVIYQDEPSLIRQMLQMQGSWGPTLVDPGGKTAIAYGVYGVPETYLINPEGVIVDKIAAPLMEPNHLYGWLHQNDLLPQ